MRPSASLSLTLVAALGIAACHPAPAEYPQGNPPGQMGPGQMGPGPWNPGGQNPGQWTGPGQNPGQWTGPQVGPPPPPPIPMGPPVMQDPISNVDLTWLRATAGGVLNELVTALPPAAQAKVQGIPFVTDPAEGEVNAYAACDEQRMPSMAMTDGILQIEAYIAQMRATDEIFGTQKLDAYLNYVVQNQKPKQPIVAPPPGMIDPAQHTDYRKVVRQHQLLEEQMAFVLGHELAHHYLGHTGCANGRSGARKADWTDILRKAQRVVPIVNQPNELAADIAGVNNLLTAGSRRQGYHWTEAGAILTLDFFARLDKPAPGSLALAVLSSHPNPAHRIPGVQNSAAEWRRTGGVGYQPMVLP